MTEPSEIVAIRGELIRMDRQLAVCTDRVERHDYEIKSLVRDVHEIRLNVTTVVSGVSNLSSDIHRVFEKLDGMQQRTSDASTAMDKARGAYSAAVMIVSGIAGAASLGYVVGKAAGWWS